MRSMVVASVVGMFVLASHVAAADTERGVVLSALGGASGAAAPDAPVSAVPFVPMIGASLAWQRVVPDEPLDRTTYGWVAPALTVELHGRRAMELANLRFELEVINPHKAAVTIWAAPGIGAITGATSMAFGGELGMTFRVHHTWEVGFIYGIYGWSEPDGTSTSLARTTQPHPSPSPSVSVGVIQGQFGLMLGRAI